MVRAVALAVTREGLPVRSCVFPGDMSDVDTVEKRTCAGGNSVARSW